MEQNNSTLICFEVYFTVYWINLYKTELVELSKMPTEFAKIIVLPGILSENSCKFLIFVISTADLCIVAAQPLASIHASEDMNDLKL